MASKTTIPHIQITQVFQCDICHVSLAAASLMRHKRTVHGDKSSGKQWLCGTCNKSLQTKSRLIAHERSHEHTMKDNIFFCEECQFSTNNKEYFADHMRRIHKPKEGMWMCMAGNCKNRPKSFINHNLLVTHRKNHENVKCTHCEKIFGAKRNMLRHVKNVHKPKEHDNTGNSNESQNDANLNLDVDTASVEIDPLARVPLVDHNTDVIVLPWDL